MNVQEKKIEGLEENNTPHTWSVHDVRYLVLTYTWPINTVYTAIPNRQIHASKARRKVALCSVSTCLMETTCFKMAILCVCVGVW